MWLMTPAGFFSVVEHRDLPGAVLVRARSRVDLDGLVTTLGLEHVPRSSPDADYPWRLTIPRTTWAMYLMHAAAAIDYDNFKGAVGRVNPGRAFTYHEVWSVLHGIEDEPTADVAPRDELDWEGATLDG